jgi:hypothetical protein
MERYIGMPEENVHTYYRVFISLDQGWVSGEPLRMSNNGETPISKFLGGSIFFI